VKLIDFMGSRPGRFARALVGLALIAVGLRSHGARQLVAVIGLVPLAAGACDVCVLGPVVGRPFQGVAFRRSTSP
jgi:hypothetical protein